MKSVLNLSFLCSIIGICWTIFIILITQLLEMDETEKLAVRGTLDVGMMWTCTGAILFGIYKHGDHVRAG